MLAVDIQIQYVLDVSCKLYENTSLIFLLTSGQHLLHSTLDVTES